MNIATPMTIVIILVFAAVTALAQFPQAENTIPCAPGATMLTYGAVTSGCAITPATDSDVFVFAGTAGESIRVSVSSSSNNLDPQLDIFDPSGAIYHTQACSSTALCAFVAEPAARLPLTGFYTMVVSDAGANNTGNYSLGLERIVPPFGTPVLTYGATVSDTLSPPVDVDWVTFNALAGDLITLSVLSTTNNLDPAVRIYDPTQGIFMTGSCGSTAICSFMVGPVAIPTSGTYHIMFFEGGTNNVGGYQFTLQCILGPSCSVTPPQLPGSGEDLALATGVQAPPTVFPDVKPATAGNPVAMTLFSPLGSYVGQGVPVIGAQVITTGTPITSPSGFPELHLTRSGAFALYDGNAGPFAPQSLPFGGINLVGTAPVSLGAGTNSLIVQGFVLTPTAVNGIFAATDAHELQF